MTEKTDLLALSLDYTKQFLRISHSNEDELIRKLIRIATQRIEEFSGIALLNREFTSRLYHKKLQNTHKIKLPRRPITEVKKIEACGYNGEKSIIPQNLYNLLDDCHIACNFLINCAHIEITYSAGIAESPETLDPTLQHVLLEMTTHLYERRGDSLALDEILERYPSLRNFKL